MASRAASSPPDDTPQAVREVALSDTADATSTVAAKQVDDEAAAPPYYIAIQPLFIDNQFSRAFNPGDRVPVDHVVQFGWADLVRRPEPAENTPVHEPETTPGQATNSKDGA
ncbi:hypothetical protein [Streptosporangium sp. V21-05]|uniref:hypothetical protein n=1 Tax=Streptosporangium sp. V21-05 TaxID=3446115 RepID=UPI003F52AAB6